MNLLTPSRSSWSTPLVLIQGWHPDTNTARPTPHSPVSQRLSRWFNKPHARSSTDTRLVLSGRINDVCAELERLAALEDQH